MYIRAKIYNTTNKRHHRRDVFQHWAQVDQALVNTVISLAEGGTDIAGRSVVIHEFEDKLLEEGDSSTAIACGVILPVKHGKTSGGWRGWSSANQLQ